MRIRKNRLSESGAIMLEVIAVLSLIGMVGSMLYRQINQRNQELHNIQMASEIRVVKEAFSGWLQVNASAINCAGITSDAVTPCQNAAGEVIVGGVSTPLSAGVKEFLPDGYFYDEGAPAGDYLNDNYDFKLFGYRQGAAGSESTTYYGVVVPKPALLPDGGNVDNKEWTFRRAARVAMLIGIDGGVFGSPTRGENEIVGAVGTWSLDATDIISDPANTTTYVAMTALDVFKPEVPSLNVNIKRPETWSLNLDGALVNRLRAGATTTDNPCYVFSDDALETSDSGEWKVFNSDTIHNAGDDVSGDICWPAFWVDGEIRDGEEKGNVFVRNDLVVGAGKVQDSSGNYDPTMGTMHLMGDGFILFNETTPYVDDSGHVQGATDKADQLNYLLDPAYTSVMNDIKIMSLGGAKLSQLIPNYILREIVEVSNVVKTDGSQTYKNIYLSSCPPGYMRAITIRPTNALSEIPYIEGYADIDKMGIKLDVAYFGGGADPKSLLEEGKMTTDLHSATGTRTISVETDDDGFVDRIEIDTSKLVLSTRKTETHLSPDPEFRLTGKHYTSASGPFGMPLRTPDLMVTLYYPKEHKSAQQYQQFSEPTKSSYLRFGVTFNSSDFSSLSPAERWALAAMSFEISKYCVIPRGDPWSATGDVTIDGQNFGKNSKRSTKGFSSKIGTKALCELMGGEWKKVTYIQDGEEIETENYECAQAPEAPPEDDDDDDDDGGDGPSPDDG